MSDDTQAQRDAFFAVMSAPINSREDAVAFLTALHNADLSYHLDDGAADCLGSISWLSNMSREIIDRQVNEIYDLPCWTRDDCPIGVLLELAGHCAGNCTGHCAGH